MSEGPREMRAPGAVTELTTGEPLMLCSDTSLRVVESGLLALYCAEVEGDVVVGPRRLLGRVGVGQAVISAPAGSTQGLGLLVVPIKDTTVREVSLADASLEVRGQTLAALAEGWVELLAPLFGGGAAPAKCRRSRAIPEVALADGEALGAARDAVAWVRVLGGSVHLLDQEALARGPGEAAFPLGTGLWLRARGDASLEVIDSGDLSDMSAGLTALHEALLTRLRGLLGEEAEDRLHRLGERSRVQAERMDEAITGLAAVIEPTARAAIGADPLWTVMSSLGQSLGVTFKAPGGSETALTDEERVEAIARASRVRMRRVKLTTLWWKRDCGDLLAYTGGEDPRPVALLRNAALRYELLDPGEGTRVRVNRDVARGLASGAVSFYRPLPEGRLSLKDLALFSLKGRRRDLTLVIVTGLIATLLGMITPQATAVLMDHAIPDANRRLLLELAGGLLAASFGITLFRLSEGIVLSRIGLGAEAESQSALWDRLLRLRPSFFRRYSSGDLQSRVMAVNEIGAALSGAILDSVFAGMVALLNLGLLYYYSPGLSLLALAAGALVAVFTLVVSFAMRRKLRVIMELDGLFFGLVIQLINGVSKLRVAGAADRAFALWGRRYSEQLKLWLATFRLQDGMHLFNTVLPVLSSAALFAFAYGMLEQGRAPGEAGGLSLGRFLAFNVAFTTFLGGVTSLSRTVVGLLDIVEKGKRVRPILEEEPESGEDKADPGRLEGEVAMEGVSFRYRESGSMVLEDVNLRAEPGEFVALVGPSGSGKSTLLRLLLGFEVCADGCVTYDGQDLANLDVRAVRRQLGVVMQGGRLDAGSILDSIASGGLLTLDQAWAAAEAAGFAEDVRAMPMGMHTIISAGGGNLSGGQRQRLLIARALARRPRALLFDEATSALDNTTQSVVSESLERLNVTRLVIAHRLSTIRKADRIYVLDGGRVVQEGSFEELLAARGGMFARMMARQMA